MTVYEMLDKLIVWIAYSPFRLFMVLWVGGVVLRLLAWLPLAPMPLAQALVQYTLSSLIVATVGTLVMAWKS